MIRSGIAKKRLPSPEHADTLSLNALRSLVTELLERSQQAEARLEKLEADNIQLGKGVDLRPKRNSSGIVA